MFVAQAHSIRQQARLAMTLAWVGGYTNIIAVLACGMAVSHVTGLTSEFGRDLGRASWRLAWYAGFLLMTFVIGAAVSGLCTEIGRRRGWDSIYVLPVVVEALLLGVFALGLEFQELGLIVSGVHWYWLTGAASMAMGLQNATITRISSGTVRTTHVTGVLTDLGHEAVQFLLWVRDRRRDVPPASARALLHSVYAHASAQRLALLAAIFVMFALGATLGTIVYHSFARWAMFPPVVFLMWIIHQDLSRPIAEIEPHDLLATETGLDLPKALAVFHLRKDPARAHRQHRMPNLLSWSERLPAATRVVVLDLGDTTAWDDNAQLDLHAAISLLSIQGRELVIAGVEMTWFRRTIGRRPGLSPDNVHSDLELAIARALNLLEQIEDREGEQRGGGAA